MINRGRSPRTRVLTVDRGGDDQEVTRTQISYERNPQELPQEPFLSPRIVSLVFVFLGAIQGPAFNAQEHTREKILERTAVTAGKGSCVLDSSHG